MRTRAAGHPDANPSRPHPVRLPSFIRRAGVLLLPAAWVASGLAAPAPVATAQGDELVAAGVYCAQAGGAVRARYPAYGTNDPDPLRLAGVRPFCEFTAEDGSRIVVALDTLYATAPTLAALAYRNPPPLQPGPPSANPSSRYCSQLGGTDEFGGVSAAGGGWVLVASAETAGGLEDVMAMCVFPDLSSIDSWGLTYHAGGVVRGADLDPLLRYHPEAARQE
jgi:putative hemolysin